MNERIKELMLHAGTDTSGKWMGVEHAEKFAELIIKECAVFVENDDYRGITLADRLKQHLGVEK
jgi:hypothetical protein